MPLSSAGNSYGLTTLESGGASDVSFSADQTLLYVAKQSGDIDVFNVATQKLVTTWHVGGSLGAMSLAPDGSFLVVADTTGSGQSTLYRVSTVNGSVQTYSETGQPFLDVQMIDQNHALVTGGQQSVTELNLTTGAFSSITGGISYSNNSIMVSDSGYTLLAETGISDGPLFIYSDTAGAVVANVTDYQTPNTGFNFGEQAISATAGEVLQFIYYGTLNIYDLNLHYIKSVNVGQPISGVAFDPSGSYAFVYLSNGGVVEYNATTWEIVDQFQVSNSGWTNGANYGDQVLISNGGRYINVIDTQGGVHLISPPHFVADDFTGDGNADVILPNAAGDLVVAEANVGSGSNALTTWDLGAAPANWIDRHVADLTGDGKADLVWRTANGDVQLWLSTGGGGFTTQDLGVVPTGWTIQQAGDFTGDGKADILWRQANGDVALWLANSGAGYTGFTGQDLGVVPTGWSIEGIGDFQASGKEDILWRQANGDVALWLANTGAGYTGFTSYDLGVVATGWDVAGVADFSGSGKAEILWTDASGDLVLWAANSGAGFDGFTGQSLGAVPAGWTIQQIADVNGDGKADIVWLTPGGESDLWASNSGSGFSGWTGYGLGLAPGQEIHQATDFNGDGGAGLVWRNGGGDVSLWTPNSNSSYAGFSSHDLGVVTTNWTLQGTGDFTGAGKAGALWRDSSGDLSLWSANPGAGFAGFSSHDLGQVPTDWTVQGIGDFNGDGKADIVWRAATGDVAIWQANGGSGFTGFSGHDLGQLSAGWTLQAVADFNGDGKADIVWRNGGGDVALWASNPGAGFTGFASQDLGVVSTSWIIAGAGDFNGDGKADILWRTPGNDSHLWLSHTGTASTGYDDHDLGPVASDWSVQQVGDFNGDGRADIVWRAANGDVQLWLSSSAPGFNGFSTHDLGIVSSDWHII